MSVMQAVQLAVSSVDDLDGLFSTLRDLGTVHTGLGIQDIHFLVSCYPQAFGVFLKVFFECSVVSWSVTALGTGSSHWREGLHARSARSVDEVLRHCN